MLTKADIWKTEVKQDCIRQSSDLKSMVIFRTCTGLVGPRLPAKDHHMIKKKVVCSPTTALLLTSTDVSTSTIKHQVSDEFGLRACKPVSLSRLTSSLKAKRYTFAKAHLKWTAEKWRKVLFSIESTVKQFTSHFSILLEDQLMPHMKIVTQFRRWNIPQASWSVE